MPAFVTEDMTFVTVLKQKGIEPTRLERSNGGVRWVYELLAVSTTIAETLDEYNAEECCVEPKDFTKKMGIVRRAMYDFLGHKHSPVKR